MLRRQLLRHRYLSEDRVRLMGMIGFLVQGRVRIRIRVRVRVRVRVYVSFNISISCRSICRRSICHGTSELYGNILRFSIFLIYFWPQIGSFLPINCISYIFMVKYGNTYQDIYRNVCCSSTKVKWNFVPSVTFLRFFLILHNGYVICCSLALW